MRELRRKEREVARLARKLAAVKTEHRKAQYKNTMLKDRMEAARVRERNHYRRKEEWRAYMEGKFQAQLAIGLPLERRCKELRRELDEAQRERMAILRAKERSKQTFYIQLFLTFCLFDDGLEFDQFLKGVIRKAI